MEPLPESLIAEFVSQFELEEIIISTSLYSQGWDISFRVREWPQAPYKTFHFSYVEKASVLFDPGQIIEHLSQSVKSYSQQYREAALSGKLSQFVEGLDINVRAPYLSYI